MELWRQEEVKAQVLQAKALTRIAVALVEESGIGDAIVDFAAAASLWDAITKPPREQPRIPDYETFKRNEER